MSDPDAGPGSVAAARQLALSRLSASLQGAEDEDQIAAPGRRHEQATAAAQTEMLIELLRTLPHELSQPLTIISGYAELLAAGRLKDQALLDACHELVEASHRLADLAQRLDRVASHARKEIEAGPDTMNFDRAAE